MSASTQAVAMAVARAKNIQRKEYVKLHGTDVILRRLLRDKQRNSQLDHWGNVKNLGNEYIDSKEKMVINFSQFYSQVKNLENELNESVITPLSVIVDLDLAVSVGDRVRFTTENFPMVEQDIEMVVSKVLIQTRIIPISKSIELVPLRDD